MAPLEVQYACESFLPVILALGAAAAAISAQQPARMALPTPASLNRLPAGATVERSGFLTIEQAPPSPVPPTIRPNRGQSELTFYAELAGISNAEAAKRLREQEALRPFAERLVRQLRTRERVNFIDVEIVHKPEWAYHVYFKREPDKTLACYTQNRRFKARWSRYSNAGVAEAGAGHGSIASTRSGGPPATA